MGFLIQVLTATTLLISFNQAYFSTTAESVRIEEGAALAARAVGQVEILTNYIRACRRKNGKWPNVGSDDVGTAADNASVDGSKLAAKILKRADSMMSILNNEGKNKAYSCGRNVFTSPFGSEYKFPASTPSATDTFKITFDAKTVLSGKEINYAKLVSNLADDPGVSGESGKNSTVTVIIKSYSLGK